MKYQVTFVPDNDRVQLEINDTPFQLSIGDLLLDVITLDEAILKKGLVNIQTTLNQIGESYDSKEQIKQLVNCSNEVIDLFEIPWLRSFMRVIPISREYEMSELSFTGSDWTGDERDAIISAVERGKFDNSNPEYLNREAMIKDAAKRYLPLCGWIQLLIPDKKYAVPFDSAILNVELPLIAEGIGYLNTLRRQIHSLLRVKTVLPQYILSFEFDTEMIETSSNISRALRVEFPWTDLPPTQVNCASVEELTVASYHYLKHSKKHRIRCCPVCRSLFLATNTERYCPDADKECSRIGPELYEKVFTVARRKYKGMNQWMNRANKRLDKALAEITGKTDTDIEQREQLINIKRKIKTINHEWDNTKKEVIQQFVDHVISEEDALCRLEPVDEQDRCPEYTQWKKQERTIKSNHGARKLLLDQ